MINVLVPTYNRISLLEEAMACFLAQDMGDSRMIILNDCPEQELVFSHPRISVCNVSERYATIGDKRNALLDLADGEYVTFWDDDDIYLKDHLSVSLGAMPLFRRSGCMKNSRAWIWSGGKKFRYFVDTAMHTMLFRRDLVSVFGRFQSINLFEDVRFVQSALSLGYCYAPFDLALKSTFVYRDTGDRYRASIGDGLDVAPPSPGVYELIPNLKADYEQMALDTLNV